MPIANCRILNKKRTERQQAAALHDGFLVFVEKELAPSRMF